MMKKLISAMLTLVLMASVSACGGDNNNSNGTEQKLNLTGDLAVTDMNLSFKQTTSTDNYGRQFSTVTDFNENLVGIFYFLWSTETSTTTNIDDFVEQGKAENTLTGDDVSYGPTFTFWGEPMYGFYKSSDEWVARKHIELFINAGLDFICFDTTNNDYYQGSAKIMLDLLLDYKEMGYNVPKVMFMTNTDSTGRTDSIYNAFYRRDKYDDIWFTGNGDKPWILANYNGSNQAVKDRFYFKSAQWPNTPYDSNKFPWISWKYPQETFIDNTQGLEIMSVSASQHVGIGGSYGAGVAGVNFSMSGLCAPYNYNNLSDYAKSVISPSRANEIYNSNWGRGYSHASGENNVDNAIKNVNFEEQWQSVYDNSDVNLVFITGWNEWIAQKQSNDYILGSSYGYFVDTFNTEFSRDIEMMNGGYSDNAFIQMVANVRKYKGVGFNDTIYHAPSSKNMLDLANWQDVASYMDLVDETLPRKHIGAGDEYYTNDTGRNDIYQTKVASDDKNIYMLIETVNDITKRQDSDSNFMNVFLGFNGLDSGFYGLEYVLNRNISGNTASVEKIGESGYQKVGDCKTYIEGKYMLVVVEKSVLEISESNFNLQFKIADNLQQDFLDITDLYTNGDVAPLGRTNYSYSSKAV